MKAKEMFEELGYESKEDETGVLFENYNRTILFDKTIKAYIVYQNSMRSFYIYEQTQKAIQQQLKELGWIE